MLEEDARVRAGRRILVLAAVAAVAAVASPTAAYARGGGGSHSFSGGGGGGGFHGGSSLGSGSGGGGGDAIGVLVVLALIVLWWLVAWIRKGRRGGGLNTVSDRVAHRSDAKARTRASQVEARVDELADTDATFDVEALKARAVSLYVTAQQAWTTRDQATLKRILSPVLYSKWSEELRDYKSRGEVNVVEIVSGPEVELVDVANREGETNDTVTFRISATLNDYVRRKGGAQLQRTDGSTRPVEYWTLRKAADGTWIVASIEQAAEGAHHLTDAIETDGWDQKAVGREAVLEVAAKTTTARSDVLSLTSISWSTDADDAAADLSLVDGRFDRSVLEVAIEQFIEEWAMNDGSLDFTAVRTANRTVMRDATAGSIQVRSLVSRDPIVFRVEVAAEGLYYEVDRATEEVLHGDARKRRPVTFTFELRLDGPAAKGWTVVTADVELTGTASN